MRLFRRVLIGVAVLVGAYLVAPASAQGNFWVMVNGVIRTQSTVQVGSLLQFGGSTGSFPALIKASTGITLGGADGSVSGFAFIAPELRATSSQITSGTGAVNGGKSTYMTYQGTVTSANAGCTAAALTCDITVATLPAKTFLRSAFADLTQTFACSATCTTATLSAVLGRGAGGAEFLASMDIDAATAQFGDADAEAGTELVRAAAIQGRTLGSWSGTTTVVMRITSGTGNLGTGAATNLSQGSITYYLTTERF